MEGKPAAEQSSPQKGQKEAYRMEATKAIKAEHLNQLIGAAISESPARSIRDVLLSIGEVATDILIVDPVCRETNKVNNAITAMASRDLCFAVESFISNAVISAANTGVMIGLALGLHAREFVASAEPFEETLAAVIVAAGLGDFKTKVAFEYGNKGQTDV